MDSQFRFPNVRRRHIGRWHLWRRAGKLRDKNQQNSGFARFSNYPGNLAKEICLFLGRLQMRYAAARLQPNVLQ